VQRVGDLLDLGPRFRGELVAVQKRSQIL
jgi:hypothetical protein